MRLVVISLLLLSVALETSGQESQPVPESERRALDAIYAQAGGNQWIQRAGWGSARGTECEWYGVTCLPDYSSDRPVDHVVGLELMENSLRGVIPDTATELSYLRSVWLWGNQLVRIPSAWQEQEDRGELDLRLWHNPIEHRVTDISLENVQGHLLCSHWMLKLSEDGTTVHAAIRCRNRTQKDRTTYCEVKKGATGYLSFPRLARFIEKSGFYDLKRSYTVNQTHAGNQIVRVTRDGNQRTVDDYGYMQPLNLLGIEMAIAGIIPLVDWETTTQHPEQYCRDIFARANDVIHTGVTYLLELPPGIDVSESEYVAAEANRLPVMQETVKDEQGELLKIQSWINTTVPAMLPDVPLVSTTLGGRNSLEHRGEQTGTYSREVFFPVPGPGGNESFVRLMYGGLSKERAAKADRIIETIDEKKWD
jgi:hypothetical protein